MASPVRLFYSAAGHHLSFAIGKVQINLLKVKKNVPVNLSKEEKQLN